MTAVLLTMAAGEAHERLLAITRPSLERYAARHGYRLRVVDPVPGLSPQWSKVPRIREALDDNSHVLWLDSDAVVVDPARDVADELESFEWQAVLTDERLEWPPACTAVWLVRACDESRAFLGEVLELAAGSGPDDVEAEQGAARHVIDRDLGAQVGTRFLGPEWGGYSEQPVDRPRIAHIDHEAGELREPYLRMWAGLGKRRPSTPAAVLRAALDVVRDPARWFGEDDRGEPLCGMRADGAVTVHSDPDATRWCAVGAIKYVVGAGPYGEHPVARVRAAQEEARRLIDEAAGQHVGALNDGDGHAAVVRAFETALATCPPCMHNVDMTTAQPGATTTVRLPRQLVDDVRVIAQAHDRSVSAELRVAVDEYVRRMLPDARRALEERAQR